MAQCCGCRHALPDVHAAPKRARQAPRESHAAARMRVRQGAGRCWPAGRWLPSAPPADGVGLRRATVPPSRAGRVRPHARACTTSTAALLGAPPACNRCTRASAPPPHGVCAARARQRASAAGLGRAPCRAPRRWVRAYSSHARPSRAPRGANWSDQCTPDAHDW